MPGPGAKANEFSLPPINGMARRPRCVGAVAPPEERVVMSKVFPLAALALLIASAPPGARAEDAATVSLTLKDHKFAPAEPTAPAGKPITIEVSNLDSTPSEFESKTLRVEKVVPAGGKASVQVRALKAGRYRFYDDYHEDTTEGFLVVK